MKRSTRGIIGGAAAIATGMALASAPMQGAENSGWVGEIGTPWVMLLHGQYWLDARVDQPEPALMYGVPAAVSQFVNARRLVGRIDWGDGTSTSITSDANPDLHSHMSLSCNSEWWPEPGEVPPFGVNEEFGYQCGMGGEHDYARQGVYTIRFTATQNTSEGVRSAWSSTKKIVVDPAIDGSMTVSGELTARSAGMYDPDFPRAGDDRTTTVRITAARPADSAATTADVVVSVPGMHPKIYNSQGQVIGQAHGMTFRGRYALAPMFTSTSTTGAQVYLTQVEGSVTNSAGSAGGARAFVHVVTSTSGPPLARVVLQNTSAGYTYLDTGYLRQGDDWFLIDRTNDRLRGTARITSEAGKVASTSRATLADNRISAGQRGRLRVKVTANRTVTGDVVVYAGRDGRAEVRTVTLAAADDGVRRVRLPRSLRGRNEVHFTYQGNDQVRSSESNTVILRVSGD